MGGWLVSLYEYFAAQWVKSVSFNEQMPNAWCFLYAENKPRVEQVGSRVKSFVLQMRW
jgi:hypothetical protein